MRLIFQVFCEFQAYQGVDNTRKICILSQNVINEKIYLFLWFWFIMLIVVAIFQLMYRFAILFSCKFRFHIIKKQIRTQDYLSRLEEFLKNDCNVGDWYVNITVMIHISVPYWQLTLLFFIMGQKMKKPSRQGREVSEG